MTHIEARQTDNGDILLTNTAGHEGEDIIILATTNARVNAINAEQLAKLPGKEAYAKLVGGAQTAIISQIKQERMQAIRDRIARLMQIGKGF